MQMYQAGRTWTIKARPVRTSDELELVLEGRRPVLRTNMPPRIVRGLLDDVINALDEEIGDDE